MGFDIGGVVGGLINKGRAVVEAGRNVVESGIDKGRELVHDGREKVEDVFEGTVARGREVIADLRGDNAPDRAFDGRLVDLQGRTYPPGTPLSQVGAQDPSKPTILHVNGISNTVGQQTGALEEISRRTGANVVGIHNATQGFVQDLAQSLGDKLDKGRNPAVDSMANTIYAELQAGRPVHVMAHSQGGIITSRALTDVQQRLMIEGGMTRTQAEQAMSNIRVESFGSAASSWPDGPQYVHYINRLDGVPAGLGLGPGLSIPGREPEAPREAGRGAVVHWFNHDGENHSFNTTYLDERVPFEQARRGDFSTRPAQPGV